jgi:hypothetical protein
MDTLEAKWNYLLEKMEYLSRVCTEQQQIEIIQQKQQQFKRHQILQPIDEQSSISNVRSSTSNLHQQKKQSIISTSKSITAATSSSASTTNVVKTVQEVEAINSTSVITKSTSNSSIKKRRMLIDEIKQHTNIDSFVAQLSVVFDTVKKLIDIENLSQEEQIESIKVNILYFLNKLELIT